jgi:hypothetical protein
MSALSRFDQRAKDDAEREDGRMAAMDRFLQAMVGTPLETPG